MFWLGLAVGFVVGIMATIACLVIYTLWLG